MSLARLRELRMVGFKSFAERTVVEFGPGISAIVGPNGSGKSNLADALRWTLGEQGRALRSRKAEDLIFAGSANRRAVGMADVSLLIDNADRLLPVDYGEVELSRRLFRSGENEYLLNGQKIRLRDLVELLDDANIADNAFLFIGQGMVDQALALRPEERRPLFEEAAGIRKHERRRRRAENELTEAESNLERVRDLLAELRPQARRLGAQAEQQEARAAAGLELAEALVAAARARLHAAETESARHADALRSSQTEADAALRDLREAEAISEALTHALSERADSEQALRDRLDAARVRVQGIELSKARAASEAVALVRERERIAEERLAATGRAEDGRRRIAAVLPEPDHGTEEALEQAERRLTDAAHDADELRAAGRADEERAATARATRARLAGDAERALQRAQTALRRQEEQRRHTSEAANEAERLAVIATTASSARDTAHMAEAAADTEAAAAREVASEALAESAEARTESTRLGAESQGLQSRREDLDARLEGPDETILRSIRARGGRRFTEGLEVDPDLRLAVEAALGDASGGVVADTDDVSAHAEAAAVFVLRDGGDGLGRAGERATRKLEERVQQLDGGLLARALRRDPDGHAQRLLARSVWVPDLDAAFALRGELPGGWRVVTRSGVVLDDVGVVHPAPGTSLLERRALRDDVVRRAEQTATDLAAARARDADAAAAGVTAEAAIADSRDALETARRARRVADEAERTSASAAENAARERAWQEALLERTTADEASARSEAQQRGAEIVAFDGAGDSADGMDAEARTALVALEERMASLRSERDDAAAIVEQTRATRDRAVDDRRKAEVGLGLAEARIEDLGRDDMALSEREADLESRKERLAGELAEATALQGRERSSFEASIASARDERSTLLTAEASASTARERLRLAEQRSRQSEVAETEARLQLEAAREGLLVELASIGEDGLTTLLNHSDLPPPTQPPDNEELPAVLEAALDAALDAWRADRDEPAAGVAVEPPSRSRIAGLRRRFNDVGASNPFAVQELAEVKDRLGSLEAQREDLETAMRDTREMIGRLEDLMTEQFRQTFEALEGAFGRRFQQLFGGGEAQLSLTDPDDFSATGVEIMARPPGKKRQALAMLSGGERALTAVALLMAMLEVRPVPFCVLDEVDAALDEANVGRFSAALRSLAEEIQFVVITHNLGTIEAADALYGVTVGDYAVSRVISLKLADLPEDDKALAEAIGA